MENNIWNFISPHLVDQPDETVWICRRTRQSPRIVTRREIHSAVRDMSAVLQAKGIQPGDCVGLMAPNGPEWTVGALAIWRLGAVLAPIHIGNSDHEITVQLEAMQPKVILSDGRRISDTDIPIEVAGPTDAEGFRDDFVCEIPVDSEACRIYTSGSTGNPKIVRLSHDNLVSNVEASSKVADIDGSDRFLALLPFSHAMGMTAVLLLPLRCGSKLVAPRVLAANEIMAAIAEEDVTILVAVPRLFRNIMLGLDKKIQQGGFGMRFFIGAVRVAPLPLKRILNAPLRKRFGAHLKAWISGGSRLDPDISTYFRALGIPLRQGYGLTETSPVVSIQDEFPAIPDSIGKPISGVEVKIDQPDDEGRGELLVRGPNVMLGYTDDAYTREAMVGEWFRTGDLARIEPDGDIVLTGRCKRLIVTEAGKNVYPEELETLLERDPIVKEAAVLELDMKPVAVLVIEAENWAEEARRVLREFNAVVSSHNRISRFALIDELPRTPLGKVALHRLPQFFQEHEVRD